MKIIHDEGFEGEAILNREIEGISWKLSGRNTEMKFNWFKLVQNKENDRDEWLEELI